MFYLWHIFQIYTGAFPDGNGQCFAGGVHMINRDLLVDGALREHIRFAFQVPILVQNLQGTQQAVGRILFKGPLIAGAV